MTLLGGEFWYTTLDTIASWEKGIKLNEALDNAFFLYDFGQGKKNMLAKGKELGWSNEQIQDATQVFDLAKNQKNIENKEAHILEIEDDIKYWQKPTGEIPFAPGVAELHLPEKQKELELLKKDLPNLYEIQDQAWSKYTSGKTEAEIDKGFESPYKLGQELRRDELISQREEDKRKVRPYMSDVWNIFPSVWSPIDTIKEKYKLQGVSGFLPGGEEELIAKARAKGVSPWLFGMSDANLADYNKKRQFRTIDELKEGPLTPKEAADLTRNKWLSYLYPTLGMTFEAGGRAGYMGGGIAAIRKPNALPPTGGPQSGGLPSLYNNGRKL